MSERMSKDRYYLEIAQQVALRSTCLRRRYGAVIVANDEIVSTGYNGAARGENTAVTLVSAGERATESRMVSSMKSVSRYMLNKMPSFPRHGRR